MKACRWCSSPCCTNHLRCADRFGRPRWWLFHWHVLGLVNATYRHEADYLERTRGSKLTEGEQLKLRFGAFRAAQAAGVELRLHA